MNRDNALKLLESYCSGIQDCSICHMRGFAKCSNGTTWYEDLSDAELEEFVDILLYGFKKISCYIPDNHIRDIKKMINDAKRNVIFVDDVTDDEIDEYTDTHSEDVRPIVHAQWRESQNLDDCFWLCSNCNFSSMATLAPRLYRYCPNCGARMKGERK